MGIKPKLLITDYNIARKKIIIKPAIINDKMFNLLLTSDPQNGGTSTGSGQYYNTDYITIKATPNSNYKFKDWTYYNSEVSLYDTMEVNNININENVRLVCHFISTLVEIQYTLTLTTNPQNAGIVTGSGIYPSATTNINIDTNSLRNYEFSNWTYNNTIVSTAPAYQIPSMQEDREYFANFILKYYNISIIDIDNSIKTLKIDNVIHSIYNEHILKNTNCVIDIVLENFYIIDGYYVNNELVSNTNNYTITNILTDYNISFKANKQSTTNLYGKITNGKINLKTYIIIMNNEITLDCESNTKDGYTMEVLEGDYSITIISNDFDDYVENITIPSTGLEYNVDLSLVKLYGKITDKDQIELQGVSLKLYDNTSNITNTTTDVNGEYQYYIIPDDDYTLSATTNLYGDYDQLVNIPSNYINNIIMYMVYDFFFFFFDQNNTPISVTIKLYQESILKYTTVSNITTGFIFNDINEGIYNISINDQGYLFEGSIKINQDINDYDIMAN